MTVARRPPPRPRATPNDPSPIGVGRRTWIQAVVGFGVLTSSARAQPLPAGSGPGTPNPAPPPVSQSASAPAPSPPGLPRPAGIQTLELQRADEGLLLSFVLGFDLPRAVEDALLKGVPLHFTAQALLMRERWYWTDRRINTAARSWRLTYQPLTRRFRVSQGGLAQNFDELDAALSACARASGWKVAEPSQLDDGARQYVDFSFRLDTSLLPRPMQIGIGGQADWNLGFERSVRVD